MKKVYIAGPYSIGDRENNVRNAVVAGMSVFALGFAPYIPHLTHYIEQMGLGPSSDGPGGWDYWLSFDRTWVFSCDYLIRLPGESRGADLEVEWARAKGIPVYFSVDQFIKENS